eukprot:SAG11_NODE_30789_length_297_cov_1.515152_1_plen_75_part_10
MLHPSIVGLLCWSLRARLLVQLVVWVMWALGGHIVGVASSWTAGCLAGAFAIATVVVLVPVAFLLASAFLFAQCY